MDSPSPTDLQSRNAGVGGPYLLTPGPLTTTARTKQAMLCDWGSWDGDFKAMTADLRRRLIELCGGGDEFDCVPIQGSGTFVIEATLGSLVAPDQKLLVLMNGAYGQRAARILRVMGRPHMILDKGDYLPPMPHEVEAILRDNPDVSYVVVVHCETSSGILNPLAPIAAVVAEQGRKLIVDAMSSFGALPLDTGDIEVEAIVSSANKCIEGVPGFGFVLARKQALLAAEGNSGSLSLDLFDQWQVMNRTGQWRFTPPTHVVAAFIEALDALDEEGGPDARLQRYSHNRDVLISGMAKIGFSTLLDPAWHSPIIVTFFSPADPAFDFTRLYDAVKRSGYILYPGKLTLVDSFRIGCIGAIDHTVMEGVVDAVASACHDMGVQDYSPQLPASPS